MDKEDIYHFSSVHIGTSSHTVLTIFTLLNFCKPFYKKEGGGCFSKNVYRMFIKIECNDYVYCQRTGIGLLGSRDIVKESLEFKPNTNFPVVANKTHNLHSFRDMKQFFYYCMLMFQIIGIDFIKTDSVFAMNQRQKTNAN